jgi:inosine-uridine nucleoside N-ribohydrolase
LVPLDACNDVPFTPAFFSRLKEDHTNPAADFVLETVTVSDMVNADEYYFWDPLTAAIATDNQIAVIEQKTVAVEVKEGIHSGRTFSSPSGHPMRVCVGADRARFERTFLDTLNGRRSSVSINP